MVNIILASHGELSKGIYNTAQMIIGEFDKPVEVISLYPGENPIDYANELKERITNSEDSWVIICDILGGSVYTALSQLTSVGDVTIFSGMNLNLVLEMLLDGSLDLSQEHMDEVIAGAQAGITCKKKLEKLEDDEF